MFDMGLTITVEAKSKVDESSFTGNTGVLVCRTATGEYKVAKRALRVELP